MKKTITFFLGHRTLNRSGLIKWGEKAITEGEIIEKQHLEQSVTTTYMPVVTSTGNTTITNMVPMIITNPETWKIVIKGYDEKKKKYVQEDFYVNQTVYRSVKKGDYFKFDPKMETTEQPETKQETTKEKMEKRAAK